MMNLLKKLPFYDKTWFQFIFFVLKRFEADRCREQAGSLYLYNPICRCTDVDGFFSDYFIH